MMFLNLFKALCLSSMICAQATAWAQLAQEPLLNRPNTVAPNLVLAIDGSGSMAANYLYEYGSGGGMGMSGPNTKTYAQYSPDVNRLYYNPRVTYAPRVDYLGNALAVSAASTSWEVYFRKTTGSYSTSQLGNLSDYYNPSYTPSAAEVVSGSTATYPNSVTSTLLSTAATRFPKFVNRRDCVTYTTACSSAEEARNHSNWNKWYSTRMNMAKTGLGASFVALRDDALRLGYATIDDIDGSNSLYKGVSSFSGSGGTSSSKAGFYNWLYGLSATSSTPNLVAVNGVGKYFERTDSDGPWASVPNPNSTNLRTVTATGSGRSEASSAHASCRRSFSMLVTDGYWNGTQPTTAGNYDNSSFSIQPAVGPSFDYAPASPYKDSASNTMADLAMYYWGRDLRTDLANRVPTINTAGIMNPSSWQNVSFYAVTLGINGTLTQSATTLAELTSGARSWPTPSANAATTIDDTWHATINGRGSLLNASNANDLTAGLNKMFTTIAGTPQTLSGVAVSTTYLKSGTRKYKPEYIPGLWAGRLSAIELDATTGNDKTPTHIFWQVEQGLNTSTGEPTSLIPTPATRNILTWNGSAALEFNATNTGLDANLVSYVRGDTSKELRKAGGIYRDRESILGDIINSTPAFIFNNVDMSYEGLGLGDYRAFVASKAARTEGVLFVGANDGMLHGFRDSNGVEVFGYVPKAVWPNLAQLASSPYTHRYYVDGPNTETDAYLGGAWKNVLIGSTGAGAKAVFALDVTTPLVMNASKVLWERSSGDAGFGNLGYVLSDVQAGPTRSGDWVAVFGNGLGSSSGVASLFVVNLQTGAVIRELVVPVTGTNGLGGVKVVRDTTQRIIGAYAGDLQGNLWKFDLSATSSGSWAVGLGSQPLYSAATSQPITAAPAVLSHPSGGYVVAFGTGKFVESSDVSTTATQRLYGVWDRQVFGSATSGAPLSGTAALVPQTIASVTTGTPPTTYYTVSRNALTWGDGITGTRGWYIDLPNSGQRLVYPLQVLSGTFVMATTLSPASSAAADACVQTGSGSGWVYILDGITGSGATKSVLDTNNDGVVDTADTVVSGWQDPIDGRPTPIILEKTTLKDTYCIETAQTTCTRVVLQCGQPGAAACPSAASTAAGLKSREWRQLFMR